MPNRLAQETSPYLLQHAGNPVDWQPWSEQALREAREQDKPILLSIGYSACHWCHVMAHESFEDAETAALMNRHYVNIKVDREERPDLDRIYQLAHQLLAQRPGGWPLTVVLDPHTLTPFFAGTYFPREPRHSMPDFKSVLAQVAEWHQQHRHEMPNAHQQMQAILTRLETGTESQPDRALLERARAELEQIFETRHGGFGSAPKFPHPLNLEFLLEHWARGGRTDTNALVMPLFSLLRMAEGGLFDQLGGGFCRYSVDARWEIPHFEKMLYDNGPLLALYSDASLLDPDPFFADVAHATADWLLREMQAGDGGFYAALDADAEGHEGKSYVWTPQEVRAVLAERDYAVFARRYGLDLPPNFEGRWHLRVAASLDTLAQEFARPVEDLRARLEAASSQLFAVREQRARPGRDDKILTAWNALAIRGLARAARRLDRPDCLSAARRALDFLRTNLWREGRLRVGYKDGRAPLPAYLDDYAFLLDAILELLQAGWRSADLHFAVELADGLLAHFEDPERGGFFFTAHDHEPLLYRPKPWADEATPSGNGIAARALLQLGHLIGEARYLDAAERCLRAGTKMAASSPVAHLSLLLAMSDWLDPPEIVIVRGTPAALTTWQGRLNRQYMPQRLTFAIPAEAEALPPTLAARKAEANVVAYVCRGTQCSAPIRRVDDLLHL